MGEMRGFRVTHAYTSIPGAQVPSSVSVSIAISFLAKKFASDSVLLILSPFPQRIILIGVEAFLPPSIKLRQSVPKSCHLTHLAVVHSLNCVQLFATLWTTAYQAPLSSTISWTLLKFISTESVMLSKHLIFCILLLLLLSISPSIRIFSNEPAVRIRWPKYWSLSFSISPSKEYSRLISFRID